MLPQRGLTPREYAAFAVALREYGASPRWLHCAEPAGEHIFFLRVASIHDGRRGDCAGFVYPVVKGRPDTPHGSNCHCGWRRAKQGCRHAERPVRESAGRALARLAAHAESMGDRPPDRDG